ncbi:bifunctional metallophosphatase/5'-nucleotidase [Cetobacterium sp. SF1]|uniref:bifunctional metallophosphatase/5'-nucleotidase n=1 Tax=Cetobacterium sp. SF1 TaxID=3417654 RepID=UPI003CF7D135
MKRIILLMAVMGSMVFGADKEVSILYFNDSHVIYPVKDKYGERGGVARIKTIVDSSKKENKNTVVIQGGDLGGGVLFGAIYHGFPMIEAFNKMPIDISNFGQHEFDFGVKEARNLVDKSKFQWISSNLKEKNGNSFNGVKEYIVKDYDGIKVGFLGTTDGMDTTIQTDEIYQENLLKSIEKNLKDLKNEKVDFVVLLTQSEPEKNIEIMEKFPEIGAILAEEKSEKYNLVTYVGEKPIVSPQGNMGSIAKLNIIKNENGIKQKLEFIPVDNSVKSDKEMEKLENFYRNKLEEDLGHKIGTLKIKLDSGFGEDHKARYEETNVGNLIADSYRNYFGTEIGFMNGGGIRASKYKGETLVEALEQGVSAVDKKSGRFLQVSGISYEYDGKLPVGSRVKNVRVNGKPIVLDQVYTVALPLYIKNGGDGFEMLKNDEGRVSSKEETIDSDIFIEYIKTIKVINPQLEGRIKKN